MKIYFYRGKANLAGERIRQVREAAGMSQEELARVMQLQGLEISQNVISRIELGRRVLPDFELKYFAKALNTTIEQLLEEER